MSDVLLEARDLAAAIDEFRTRLETRSYAPRPPAYSRRNR